MSLIPITPPLVPSLLRRTKDIILASTVDLTTNYATRILPFLSRRYPLPAGITHIWLHENGHVDAVWALLIVGPARLSPDPHSFDYPVTSMYCLPTPISSTSLLDTYDLLPPLNYCPIPPRLLLDHPLSTLDCIF